jgi:hypothetical protein
MAKDANDPTPIHGPETSHRFGETARGSTNGTNRRETLYQRADEDTSLVFTKDEFQEMLKDPEALYDEIVELITKTRDLRAYSENYRE